MSNYKKNFDSDILKLSPSDDQSGKKPTYRNLLSIENNHRQKALVSLMLDTYKNKLESQARKEAEQKYKTELERKLEVEQIKVSYDSLHFEREKMRLKDLEDKVAKYKKQVGDLRKIMGLAREAKHSLDMNFIGEQKKVHALTKEKKKIQESFAMAANELATIKDRSRTISNENSYLSKRVEDLEIQLFKKSEQIDDIEVYRKKSNALLKKESALTEKIASLLEDKEKLVSSGTELRRACDESQESVRTLNSENEKLRLKQQEFNSIIHAQKRTLNDLKQQKSLSEEKIKGLTVYNERVLSDFDVAHKLLKEKDLELATMREKFAAFQKEVSETTGKIQRENQTIRRAVEEAYTQIEERDIENGSLLDKLNAATHANEALRQESNSYVKEIQTLHDVVQADKKVYLADLAQAQQKYDVLRDENRSLHEEAVSLSSSMASHNEELSHLKNELFLKEESYQEIKSELLASKTINRDLDSQLKQLQESGDALQWENSFLKKHIKELTESHYKEAENTSRCIERLKEEVKESESSKEQLQRENADITAQAETMRASFTTMEEKIETLTEQKETIEKRITEERTHYTETLHAHEETQRSHKNTIDELSRAIDLLKGQKSNLSSLVEEKDKHILVHEKVNDELRAALAERETIITETKMRLQGMTEEKVSVDEECRRKEAIIQKKESEVSSNQSLIGELTSHVNQLKSQVTQLEKKNKSQVDLFSRVKNEYSELEASARRLLGEREKMVRELQRLKVKLDTANESTHGAKELLDSEIQKRHEQEKEKILFEERYKGAETTITSLHEEIAGCKVKYDELKDSFDTYMQDAESEKEKDRITIASVELQNKRFNDQTRKLKEELKQLSVLDQEIVALKKEILLSQDKIAAMNETVIAERNIAGELKLSLEKEQLSNKDISHQKEMILKEKENLQESINTYMHSIDDMQVMLTAEKERNKNLESERVHLKKCLEIAQRAFNVNKKITNLKSEEDEH